MRIDNQVTSVNAAGMAAYTMIYAMIQGLRFKVYGGEKYSEHAENPEKHVYYQSSKYLDGTKLSYEITWDSSRDVWAESTIAVSNADSEADYLTKIVPYFEEEEIDGEDYQVLKWSIKGVLTEREWSILTHMFKIFNFFGEEGIGAGDREMKNQEEGGDWRKQGGFELIPPGETQYTSEWLRKLLPEWHQGMQ